MGRYIFYLRSFYLLLPLMFYQFIIYVTADLERHLDLITLSFRIKLVDVFLPKYKHCYCHIHNFRFGNQF